MDKQRARDILKAHACCSFTNIENELCMVCPWNDTEDCKSTAINEEVIIKAMNTLKGIENMKKIKLSEIKVTSAFAESIPSEKKMNECRENWNKTHKQNRVLDVNRKCVLLDGYIQYLVLKENEVEEVEVRLSSRRKNRLYRKNIKNYETTKYRNNPTTYIFGTHFNSNCTKEFVWRVPASWGDWANNIEIGDTILCQTKFGFSPVVVSRVETLSECPIELRVKKVARKEIRRNGVVVELFDSKRG